MQYRRSRLQGSASSLALVCPPPVCAWTTGGGGGVGCEVDESPFASISTPTAFNAALTARDFIDSLHQNNKSTLLYGKNHVFVQVVCSSLLFSSLSLLHSSFLSFLISFISFTRCSSFLHSQFLPLMRFLHAGPFLVENSTRLFFNLFLGNSIPYSA